MAYSAKSQATYNKKCDRYAIKYVPTEQKESDRLKAYLDHTGQSANSYIKGLIKADLDAKGFSVDDSIANDTNTNNNNDGVNDMN